MSEPPPDSSDAFWRRLMWRWFVEFNPLYLLSATLVLTGCFLLSRGLASSESDWAPIRITLVSEVYAFALAGGAALLVRIGQRRPATMLALLFVLYQWDLTLHTETCALLGAMGPWAAAAWLAIFGAKIRALAWALRLRFARRIEAAGMLGALGLALGPHVVPGLGARAAGALVAAWCFALGALARPGGVDSREPLGAWGGLVLSRATRAAWLLSAALLGAHVLFWASDHAIDLATPLAVAPLLIARAARSEGRAWGLVAGTALFVAVVHPAAFSITALLAAATLVVRALAPAFDAAASAERGSVAVALVAPPYRTGVAVEPSGAVVAPPAIAVVGEAERARSFAGALFAVHLAAWTASWSHGPWPPHVLGLDAALAVAVALLAWRLRVRSALAPLAACAAHLALEVHLVSPPRTPLEWGGVLVAVGFALLGGSLGASYRLRERPLDAPPARGTPGG